MDRKQWQAVIEEAIDRYRAAVAAESWPGDADLEDHIVQFAQELADVGRSWLT